MALAQTWTVVGRAAAARRDGPGHSTQADRVLDGRAAVEPRCETPGADACRSEPASTAPGSGDYLCHARPDGGADDGAPRRGTQVGRAPAVRHPPGHLRQSGEPVCRGVHRVTRDESLRSGPG